MKRKSLVMILILAILAAFAGCGENNGNSSGISSHVVKLPDKSTVVCVMSDMAGYGGGVTCDWNHIGKVK